MMGAQFEWSIGFDPVVVPLMLDLARTRKNNHLRVKEICARHLLTPAEFDVLATLRNCVPPFELIPSEIQNRALITSGGLTKVLHQLEVRGLISRIQAGGDQRVKPVKLTKLGSKLISKAMKELAENSGTWIRQTLSNDEIIEVSKIMKKLADSSDERILCVKSKSKICLTGEESL